MDDADPSLLSELKWVHSHVRHDLSVCRRLASEVITGAPADVVRAEVTRLKMAGPLFQLKVNCLRYCQFVHGHHGLEDAMLFPAVRRVARELEPDVDRLESDHRSVATLLDQVELQAALIDDGSDPVVRQALSDALTALADVLLEHLDREETVLGPVLGRASSWSELFT